MHIMVENDITVDVMSMHYVQQRGIGVRRIRRAAVQCSLTACDTTRDNISREIILDGSQ